MLSAEQAENWIIPIVLDIGHPKHNNPHGRKEAKELQVVIRLEIISI